MPIQKASNSDGVNYKYEEPKTNNKGLVKGLVYQKVDKATGEVKLKNSSGIFEKLMLKARGYNKMTSGTGINFLNARFPNAQTPPSFNISTPEKNSS